MKTLLVISLGLFAMSLDAPCCWANDDLHEELSAKEKEQKKCAQEVAALLPPVYEKSWPIIEVALDFLRKKDSYKGVSLEHFIIEGPDKGFYFEDGGNNSYSLKKDKEGWAVVKISGIKMEEGKLVHAREDEQIGSFPYNEGADFIPALLAPIHKALEKGQRQLSYVRIYFSLNCATIVAVDKGEGLGNSYYYRLKNNKWTFYYTCGFDV